MPAKKPAPKQAPRARSGAKAEGRVNAASVEGFFAALPADKHAALQKLRGMIRAAAPEATEGLVYRTPGFKLDGHPLVSYGVAKKHCSFYLMSYETMRTHAADLAKYKLGLGSVAFPADEPLPATLVKKLVATRIREVRARFAKRR